MRVFKDVGLVEQLGSGMSRILKAYDRDIFQISEHFIKAVFPYAESGNTTIIATGDDNGNDNGNEIGDDEKVLGLLKEQPSITVKELSVRFSFSTRKISRIMKKLRENGKITRVGSDRKGYWKINE